MLYRNWVFFILVILIGCDLKPKPLEEAPILALSLEQIYSSPSLTGSVPFQLKVSPDGKHISFLKAKDSNQKVLDLWEYDLQKGKPRLLVDSSLLTGDQQISAEERARRERKRIHQSGIVEYHWSHDGKSLLFPINGDIYVYKILTQEILPITQSPSYELDPRFSPRGRFVSFIRDHNLVVYDLEKKMEFNVTTTGTTRKPFAVAEFIAQEEMGRYRGYWWSPDENHIVFTVVDLEPVERMKRFEVTGTEIKVIDQSYPRTGTKNARVRLKLFNLENRLSKDIPSHNSEEYIPSVSWLPKNFGSQFVYTVQDRSQTKLKLKVFDVNTFSQKRLLEESDPAWVNIRHDFLPLKKQKKLVWVSEKSGAPHIQLIDLITGSRQALTSGEWAVDALLGVNETLGHIYFTGNKGSAVDQFLFQVDLKAPHAVTQITPEVGVHEISMSKNPGFFIDHFSNKKQLPSVRVRNMDGSVRFTIFQNKIDDKHPIKPLWKSLGSWVHGSVKTKDGTSLYYKVLKPKVLKSGHKYPVLHYVYGGPGARVAENKWGKRDLFFHYLVQQGFVVFMADNRGTPGRGRDFERAIHKKFGVQEVADQSYVLESLLKKYDFMDETRVGVFGHSYGGYLSLMLMMQKPQLYQAGVSGAPVTDWTLYDTHYTERFLGTPEDNPEVYSQSNVMSYTDQLTGRLLVVHGMADDNVLFNHSLKLFQKLQGQKTLFDTVTYPGAKHSIRAKKAWQIHYRKAIADHFRRHLEVSIQ